MLQVKYLWLSFQGRRKVIKHISLEGLLGLTGWRTTGGIHRESHPGAGRRACALKLLASWHLNHVRAELRLKDRVAIGLALTMSNISPTPLSHSGCLRRSSTERPQGAKGTLEAGLRPDRKPTTLVACQLLVKELHQFTMGRALAGGNEKLIYTFEHNREDG